MAIDITKKSRVSLSKVVLAKTGDSTKVNLSKSNDNIVINLDWTQNKGGSTGLLASIFGGNQSIDLDLGCFYELNNGICSVIDGVQFSHNRGGAKNKQTRQGCYTDLPYIWHCGDDRGKDSSSGENILVNPQGVHAIRRMVIYCFIYDGIARWSDSDAVITIKVPNQPDIVVEMGKQNDSRRFCAIASIYFNGCEMSVTKEVTFHGNHEDCDRCYGWGLNWGAGSK